MFVRLSKREGFHRLLKKSITAISLGALLVAIPAVAQVSKNSKPPKQFGCEPECL